MFVRVQRSETQTDIEQIGPPTTGTLIKQRRSDGLYNSTVTHQFDTPQAPNTVRIVQKAGWGFFAIQSTVVAACSEQEKLQYPDRTCKGMRFGVVHNGAKVNGNIYRRHNGVEVPIGRAGYERATGGGYIFIGIDRSPILCRLLEEAWGMYNRGGVTRDLLLQNTLTGLGIGAASGAVVGLAGAAYIKAGAAKGFMLGGAVGATVGGAIGTLWGYSCDQDLRRARAHDEALAAVLNIFIDMSNEESRVRAARMATARLNALRDANDGQPADSAFKAAWWELYHYTQTVQEVAEAHEAAQ